MNNENKDSFLERRNAIRKISSLGIIGATASFLAGTGKAQQAHRSEATSDVNETDCTDYCNCLCGGICTTCGTCGFCACPPASYGNNEGEVSQFMLDQASTSAGNTNSLTVQQQNGNYAGMKEDTKVEPSGASGLRKSLVKNESANGWVSGSAPWK